jgi:molybdenum cofactor biosynthesis enzyme MoaA
MPQEMTREQIVTALGAFLEMGTWKVNLDGDEPLAHKYVDEIVRRLTDRGVSTRMNMNGILVPKKIETIKRLARVKISLDGLKARHDAARGKGVFDKALTGCPGSTGRWSATRGIHMRDWTP